MGLFSRKPQALEPTGFKQFLQNDRKYYWVADYIDNQNEILEGEAFADMENDSQIGQFTMPKFKKLVAKLHAQYLEADEELTEDARQLLEYINNTPINITIRRIKAKASGNNWSVQYLGRTVYYGKTLNEAFGKLLKNNEKVAKKFSGPVA